MSDREPRPPAPPYVGEGPFALWHFSEDGSLEHFVPRPPPESPESQPVVWAVDTRHAPLYWFPRDCPRGCVWVDESTTAEDRATFFGLSAATRLHVVESTWVERLASCRLYAYELPDTGFTPHGVGGYWTSTTAVTARRRVEVGDLLARHATSGFELRLTPSIWPFWHRVVASSLGFSGCRLRNSVPEQRA
jgi:hypothetical protein